MPGNKKLFLSAVSSEFISYRNLLAADLKRPNLDVAVQEDFVVTGGKTLEKLDSYIRQCDAVGRYGGEEFVLLLPKTSLQDAIKAA